MRKVGLTLAEQPISTMSIVDGICAAFLRGWQGALRGAPAGLHRRTSQR